MTLRYTSASRSTKVEVKKWHTSSVMGAKDMYIIGTCGCHRDGAQGVDLSYMVGYTSGVGTCKITISMIFRP